MASRKTIRINFMGIPSQLKELVSEIPDHAQFIKRHGYLLDLVISGFEEDMMHVLFQFFDPKHHCFTFLDYQLVPINWFLIKKAREFLKAMSFHAFKDIVALLIYGLVLFPNSDQFIDVNAIKIFLTCNLVPTLLGDILHSLHTRTIKRQGTLMCFIPLLSRWFISYLPQSVMKNEQRLKWSQRLMSLSDSDIRWCLSSQKDFTFIERCGEFPNVPLLGIRGGITYNPSLALRQFGFARRDGPHDMLLQDIVFDYNHDLQNYHRRFIHAWGMVKKTDTKTLGHKNSIPWEPYLKWV